MRSAGRRSPIARSGTGRRRKLATLTALAAALVAMPACGDEDGEPAAEPLGQKKAGSVAPLVQCRDWNTGSDEEQLATIADIRSQINLEDGTVKAPPLSDAEARQVFDSACANEFAQTFRLYVIYARAAAFAPLTREP